MKCSDRVSGFMAIFLLFFKDFAGDDYKIHTKCITEEEKYSAKGWQPRASANKVSILYMYSIHTQVRT